MCSRLKFVAVLLLLFPLLSVHAEDKKPKQDSQDKTRPTFRLPVNLIVVNATVSDKDGNPVTDLVQSDFKVYQDGKLQPIQTFAAESYEPERLERPVGVATPESSRASEARGNRPRMVSLVIDDITAGSRDNFPQVIAAVKRFIEEDVLPDDQVAIAAGSGRVQFPFSKEKQTLLEEINTVLPKLSADNFSKEDCPTLTDLQAKRISEHYADDVGAQATDFLLAVQETMVCMSLDPEQPGSVEIARNHIRMAASRQSQESEYRTSTLLRSLRMHLRLLKHFDAAKSMVLFSDGFLSEGISHISYELQDVVDQALSSGVILNTVDIRGLYTTILPASERTISVAASATAYKQSTYLDDMLAQDAPLARMANETGGIFFHNDNDLHQALKKIAHRSSFYYVLTYAMPSQKFDGRFHQIKLEVSRPGLELSYRKGYYAPKEELTFERRKKEDILEALRSPGNLNEIPIQLAYNYYQEDVSTYQLALSTNVSIRGLHFLDEDSRRKNLINLVVAAFDEMDHYVDGIEKSIDFKLTDASYSNVLAYGINSKVEFKLPMGRYKIKAVVREGAEGKMGSATRVIEIP